MSRTLVRIWRAGDASLSPCAPVQPSSLGVAGGGVVRVGAADEAELERVDAERLLEAQAVLQRVAHQVAARVRRRSAAAAVVGPLVRDGQLLEGAQLVVRADAAAARGGRSGTPSCPSSGGSRPAARGPGGGAPPPASAGSTNCRPSLRLELCGMMTASQPVPAFRQLRSIAVQRPCGTPPAAVSSWLSANGGTWCVAEDDVAVQVPAERARRVLVADEAGEGARRPCGRRPPRPPPGSPATPTPRRRRSRRRARCRRAATAAGCRCRRERATGRSSGTAVCGVSRGAEDAADVEVVRRPIPASRRGATSPKNSAWSVTAAKSSGRSRRAVRVCASSVVRHGDRARRARRRRRRAARRACRRCTRRPRSACATCRSPKNGWRSGSKPRTRLARLGALPRRRRGARGRREQDRDGERQPESSAEGHAESIRYDVFAVKPRRSAPRTSFGDTPRARPRRWRRMASG